jgi:hypothetical protein
LLSGAGGAGASVDIAALLAGRDQPAILAFDSAELALKMEEYHMEWDRSEGMCPVCPRWPCLHYAERVTVVSASVYVSVYLCIRVTVVSASVYVSVYLCIRVTVVSASAYVSGLSLYPSLCW